LQEQLGELQEQLGELQEQLGNFADSLGRLSASLRESSGMLRNLDEPLCRLEESLCDLAKTLCEFAASLCEFAKTLGQSPASLRDFARTLGPSRASLRKVAETLGQSSVSLGESTATLRRLSSSLGSLNTSLREFAERPLRLSSSLGARPTAARPFTRRKGLVCGPGEPMIFRLSLSFRLSASFASTLALAACSGQVASTPMDGGGTPIGTCAGACSRIYQLPCVATSSQTEAQCEQHCASGLAQAQNMGCGSQFAAILECVQTASITCDAQGNADTSACDAQTMAADRCANPPPPGCEAIPYPGGGAMSCTAAVEAPDAGPLDGTHSCSDSKGNTWTSTCTGASCSCGYNGMTYCSCMLTSGGVGCCPGA
jgi:hypothetical protein